jgi:hypothetical protein
MKIKIILIGLCFAITQTETIHAQIKNKNVSNFFKCIDFKISKPLRELAEMYPATKNEAGDAKEANDGFSHKRNTAFENQNPNNTTDNALQRTDGDKALAPPLVNFQGLTSTWSPLDPSGAAGKNHYVQAINTIYSVFDKKGNSLMNSLNLNNLWPGTNNAGDPIVMYDKFADRWFIQQFQYPNNGKVLIAISTSPDPTGTFYQYTFLPVSNELPDYLKFSIWSDGYYMTANFVVSGGVGQPKVVVFERDKMLLGDKNAGMIVSPNIVANSSAPFLRTVIFGALTLNADGALPPNGTPNYFMYFTDDNHQSGVSDGIAVYKVATNWANKTATVTFESKIATQSFNSFFDAGTSGLDALAQPGTSQKICALNGFLAYRATYRIWTGYNSMLLSHTVNIGNNVAGIRWYELRQDDPTKPWSIYQQGTYGPQDGINRWVPSIAMDDDGNIGLAYAVVSSTKSVYPGLRYTGRLASDPLGQMTFKEETAIDGTSATTNNRFGDYSHTSLDPDGYTFWHTGEYVSSGRKTRIFSFRIASPNSISNIQSQAEYKITQSDDLVYVNANRLPNNDITQVDLFDINGKLISESTVAPSMNSIATAINIHGLAKGMFLVRIGNSKFQHVSKISIH